MKSRENSILLSAKQRYIYYPEDDYSLRELLGIYWGFRNEGSPVPTNLLASIIFNLLSLGFGALAIILVVVWLIHYLLIVA